MKIMYIKQRFARRYYKIGYVIRRTLNGNLVAMPQKIRVVEEATYYRQPEETRIILSAPAEEVHSIKNLLVITKIADRPEQDF